MSQQFLLEIKCARPHESFSRKIPFCWKPSHGDIFDSLRRLRAQCKDEGDSRVVKVRSITVSKIEVVERFDLQLTTLVKDPL